MVALEVKGKGKLLVELRMLYNMNWQHLMGNDPVLAFLAWRDRQTEIIPLYKTVFGNPERFTLSHSLQYFPVSEIQVRYLKKHRLNYLLKKQAID